MKIKLVEPLIMIALRGILDLLRYYLAVAINYLDKHLSLLKKKNHLNLVLNILIDDKDTKTFTNLFVM